MKIKKPTFYKETEFHLYYVLEVCILNFEIFHIIPLPKGNPAVKFSIKEIAPFYASTLYKHKVVKFAQHI